MPMQKKTERPSTVLYRTHRPRTFDDVRGQDHITKVLQAALKNNKHAHAYLFVGTRGTGKTSVARILARELGVSDKDLYEIDAASHTGVDNIRELREAVQVLPFESPYKFYIIDEAHMLSKQAWNALLKTIEEPPPHALFVLATTERDKVPDTIQSRCEVYTFKQPTRAMLSSALIDIAKKEGYALEESAAELIALLAEGSFRDALSVLQKVLAVSKDKNIDVAEVELVSGAPRGELLRSLMKALGDKDVSGALQAVGDAVSANLDMRILTRLLIHRLRVVLLMRFAPEIADNLTSELTDADVALARDIVKNPGITSETLRALLKAYGEMAYAAVPHVPLELAIIELTGTKEV